MGEVTHFEVVMFYVMPIFNLKELTSHDNGIAVEVNRDFTDWTTKSTIH